VKQRQEDVKMKAIDRLYKKLYGYAAPEQTAAAQKLAAVEVLRGRHDLSSQPLSSVTPRLTKYMQQLQAASAPLEPVVASIPPDQVGPETKAQRITDEKAELKRAEADAEKPWSGDGDYGAKGVEIETRQHHLLLKRRNFVSSILEHMEYKAYNDGIETQNDVNTIHRLQKSYPYNIRDVSQKWAMCAKNAADLSSTDRATCADHFVWLMLKRSINQSYCDPDKKNERDCAPTNKVRNPGFDACLNPMLTDVQVHDCLLRITQIVKN